MTIDDLCRVVENAANSGVRTITLIGGEIFHVHDDLSQIFKIADSKNVYFSLNTNLLFPDSIERLARFASLKNIAFSLDGASPQTHDRIRGRGNFEEVITNYKSLKNMLPPRVTFDVNFVLNGINRAEAYDFISLTNNLAVRKINLATTEVKGFAAKNKNFLELDPVTTINALAAFFVVWKSLGTTELELNLPPLLVSYFKQQYNIEGIQPHFEGCGGTSVYGYVDNFGNHMPCPSMSVEQNRNSPLKNNILSLSAINRPLEEIWRDPLFVDFEKSRRTGTFAAETMPCKHCVFLSQCRPCTHEAVSGNAEPNNHLCSAILSKTKLEDHEFVRSHFPAMQT